MDKVALLAKLLATVLVFALVLVPQAQAAPVTPFISGSAATPCFGFDCTLNLLAQAGDVMMVTVGLSPQSVLGTGRGCVTTSGCYAVLTSLTTSGLTWQEYLHYTTNPGSGDGSFMWTYWTVAPSTGSYLIAAQTNNTDSAWNMVAYSITDADTADPFSTGIAILTNDAGVPSGGTTENPNFNDCNPSGSDHCGVSITTSIPDALVIAGLVSEGNICSTLKAPSKGFTTIDCASNGFGGTATAYDSYPTAVSLDIGGWNANESALWWAMGIAPCVGSCLVTTTSTTTSGPCLIACASSSTTSSSSTTTGSSSTAHQTGTGLSTDDIVVIAIAAFGLIFLASRKVSA